MTREERKEYTAFIRMLKMLAERDALVSYELAPADPKIIVRNKNFWR